MLVLILLNKEGEWGVGVGMWLEMSALFVLRMVPGFSNLVMVQGLSIT